LTVNNLVQKPRFFSVTTGSFNVEAVISVGVNVDGFISGIFATGAAAIGANLLCS
jgi:hypothetical protein